MEPYMWTTAVAIVAFYCGIFLTLVVTGYARAVEVAERPLRLEEPGAVVERLDAGREWSVREPMRVLH
jgi:hypothetical protein